MSDVLTGFLSSWRLFGDAYVLALTSAALLGLLGVVVVGRGQMFVGAAIGQSAALGTAIALLLTFLGWLPATIGPVSLQLLLTIATGVAASLWIGRGRSELSSSIGVGDERSAIVFVSASALAIVMLADLPQGTRQLQAVLGSSVLGASRLDVILTGTALAGVVAGAVVFGRRLGLLLTDPTMAAAIGMRLGVWSLLLAAVLGGGISLSIATTGFLFTFGVLVLAPLAARELCRRTATVFVLAPIVGFVGTLIGLIAAFGLDLPPGPMAVCALAVTYSLLVAGRRAVAIALD
ncbi:MAG: metal ABC transporter permease [Planctomycetota bacterium]